MRASPNFMAAALAGLIVLTGAVGCTKPDRAPAPKAPAAGERLTIAVREIADLKPVAAVIATRDQAEARARIGGVLISLAVKEGDQVRQGQRIGLVADERLRLETTSLAAQAGAAKARADVARSDFERTRQLAEKGFYSASRLDQDRASAEAAQRLADAAEAQRAAAAELAGQGAIAAPSSGRVLAAKTPAGSVVAPGASIATITSGPAIVRLKVPEAQGPALAAGLAVTVRGAGGPGEESEGRIIEIYPAVEDGMVRADVRVAGLDAGLVGRRVEVLVPVGRRRAIVLPRRFIAHRHGLDLVRVLGRDGAVGEVPVQLAPGPDTDSREVLSGLAAGDVVLAPARAQ